MGKKSKSVGANFESAMARFFRAADGCDYVVNWNDRQIPATLRQADIQACWHGLSILCECKTTLASSLPFNVISDLRYYDEDDPKPKNNQRNSLFKHTLSGGLSIVAVQHRTSNSSRVWLLSFQFWEHLRRELPRKSLPLTDAQRPKSLHEIGRFSFLENFSSHPCEQILQSLLKEARETPLVDYRFS